MHAGALKVLVYEHTSLANVYAQSSQNGTLSAVDFASADVVLTTYETLQKDFYRQVDPNAIERSLRHPKKYEVSRPSPTVNNVDHSISCWSTYVLHVQACTLINLRKVAVCLRLSKPLNNSGSQSECWLCASQVLPTPLTRLRWWRLCLDEAQMVETTTARAAKLAVQIQAQHRQDTTVVALHHLTWMDYAFQIDAQISCRGCCSTSPILATFERTAVAPDGV